MHRFFMVAGLLGSLMVHAASAADQKPFSVDDLVRLDRVSDPQLSPDGRYVAFTVQETDMDADKRRADLWLLDFDSDKVEPRRLTRDPANDTNPRWSADSKNIYFLSTRSGSSQVWRLSLEGGEAMQVTRLPVDVNALKVAPRGNRLLVSLDVFADCADLDCTAKRVDDTAKWQEHGHAHDRLFVRHWSTWDDGRQAHLYTIGLDAAGKVTGTPVSLSGKLDADIPSRPLGGDEEFNFSPDGSRVAFAARIRGKTEAWSTNFDVYESAADGSGEPQNLTADNKAWDTQPNYSADGRTLAWIAMDRPGFEADRFHLVVKDLKSGAVRALTKDWDRSIGHFAIAPDGQIYATADNLGQEALWTINLRTGKPSLVQAQGQVPEFSVGPQSVVYALASLTGPVDLYSVNLGGGRSQRLTHFNSALLGSRMLGVPEQFTFSGWNGETVYGYVVKPAQFAAGSKYPIAFIVHGGPQVSFGNAWSYRWNPQVYAGAGYAVVFIDFHGSPGYGQAFTDSISQDWGGKPLEDLRKGLAAATEKYPWLDGQRACALGASYGGYMMNWIAGNWSDGFRCIVNHAGIFDARGMYYQTEELWFEEWENGGPEFEKPENYAKFNPVDHVAAWRTPMLVTHGQQDFRVPYGQGISAFTALQRRGIESRLVIFPDENHWILKPHDSLQWHHEVLTWLDKYLKGS
ncbi:MAG TPA: S9 family peptidase [Steroidobacteraceae bacterium]|nr:S9 family peptidase [Steroidobacteraceae bacterium]